MAARLGFIALFVLSLLAAQAIAEGSSASRGKVKWRCWYDQDVHITCLIDSISDAGAIAELPVPIPEIAEEMRRDYGPGQKFFVHIPLHTQPGDAEFTALLARNTVCGSHSACSVDFSMKPPSDDDIDAMLGQSLPVAEPGLKKPDDRPL